MINIVNIMTALEELLAGTIGSTRTMTGSTVDQAVSGDHVLGAQTAVRPTIDVTLGPIEDNPASPLSIKANYRISDLSVLIKLTRHLPSEVDITARSAARSGVLYVADQIVQAMSYPGNLALTSGGLATDIIGGCLVGAKISAYNEDWDRHLISTEIIGKAIVKISQSV